MQFAIVMAIIGMVLSLLQNPDKKGRAVAIGALAGLGSYYASQTEWGQSTLQSLDGAIGTSFANGSGTAVLDANGNPVYQKDDNGLDVLDSNGQPVPLTTPIVSGVGGITKGVSSIVSEMGPGTLAAIAGIATVALAPNLLEKYAPWLIGGGLLFLFSR